MILPVWDLLILNEKLMLPIHAILQKLKLETSMVLVSVQHCPTRVVAKREEKGGRVGEKG